MSMIRNAWSTALCCMAVASCGTPGADKAAAEDPVRVIQLQNVDADELALEFQDELGKQAQFVSDTVTNALMVFGPEPLLDQVEDMAIQVDVYDSPANSMLRCAASDVAR